MWHQLLSYSTACGDVLTSCTCRITLSVTAPSLCTHATWHQTLRQALARPTALSDSLLASQKCTARLSALSEHSLCSRLN